MSNRPFAAVALACLGLTLAGCSEDKNSARVAFPGQSSVLKAEDLYAEFAADPKGAEAKYRGRRILVTGDVVKTGANYQTEELTIFYRGSPDGRRVGGTVSLAKIRQTKYPLPVGVLWKERIPNSIPQPSPCN